jgi:hypothetical protein
VIVVAVALLATSASASATQIFSVPTRVTIANDEDLHFIGRVIANSYEPCVPHRKVVLFRVIDNGPDQPLGRDLADVDGDWSLTVQGFAGVSLSRFYAKVTKTRRREQGTIAICSADRSRTTRLEG